MRNREEEIEQAQRDYIVAVNRNIKGLTHLSTGLCASCEVCKDEHGVPIWDGRNGGNPTEEEFANQIARGGGCCEPFFSWLGCDICDSSLGGSFEPWHGVDAHGEIVHGERACVDCVQYLANGTLPGSDK